MAFYLSTVFLLSTVVALATSQTFQYSRGWTNGKRAENSVLPGIPTAEFKLSGSSVQSSGARMMDVPTPCQLQKLKMLLQGNGNEQLYLLPCELLSVPRVSLADFPMGHFRRGSTLESNNNY
ncbi:pro-corazonin [Cephus cinctus]|uniref:Pro-corazonin n=1 Tax=Cephus cinctus TaxID=211228 RepID=A0AAJ7BG63_CEPCN|nr:pro-corazonin [Cephus cinctus]XP_015585291.1 pro-corazonin [Cephus cinctus]XP_024936343.1 pro-corazonin [Cephus cinctus]XP_024936344.1 pro-corazonin [Cephus cinctus]